MQWKIPEADATMIGLIVDRAHTLYGKHDVSVEKIDIRMDLIATHANGCPLDLQRLLDADDFNLLHDVGGINQHLDRSSGQLTDHFLPRCAQKVAVKVPEPA